MNKGVIISGIGHLGLILWAMLGGWLFAAQKVPEIKVVDVQMISTAEFDAMMSAAPAVPDVAPEAASPPVATSEPAVATPAIEPDPAPETLPAPPVEAPPETAPLPEPAPVAPAPQPEPVPAPVAPPADVPQPIQVPRQTKVPKPRPAVKISDAPPQKAPDTPITADQATPPTSDLPAPDQPVPDQPAAQPEETTPVVTPDPPPVTEAAPVLAPTSSKRPQSRPKAAVKPVETAKTAVAAQAAKDQAAAAKAARKAADQAAADQATAEKAANAQADQAAADQAAADQAAIDAAVAAAASGGQSGPPMTSSEIDGVRVAIKQCWNLGTLSSAAMEVKVTVRVDVGQDGRPDSTSIRMTGFEGGEEGVANQVFEAARRAIIRCGRDGLPLPADKYETWKDLELVFAPTGMRLR